MTRLQPKDDEVTDVIRHNWNVRAATFDNFLGHGLHSNEQREAWLELLARLAGDPPQRILDAGCGTGFLALLFAELGHSTTGTDFAADMLSLAQQKAKQAHLDVVFRLEDAASLSDPDESYDLVVARHVIWTLPDPARAVAEWLRVLKPGGRLAVIEGKWPSKETMADHLGSMRTTLADIAYAGLTILSYLVGPEQRPRLFRRLYARRYRRIEAKLPFFGVPAERLMGFLEAQGLRDVTVEPLMNAALWGGKRAVRFSRYLVVGKR